MRHGLNAYTNGECRCEQCRAEHAVYQASARKRRAEAPLPPGVEHGKLSTYNNYACHCDACRRANTEYKRRRRLAL